MVNETLQTYSKYFVTTDWGVNLFLFAIAEIIIAGFAALANFLVLLVIIKKRKLHTVTNVFFANMAITDILLGIYLLPLSVFEYHGMPRDRTGCLCTHSVMIVLNDASIAMLTVLAVEKFIAVRLPFFYDRIITPLRALLVNGFIWFLCISLSIVPIELWNEKPEEILVCSFNTVMPMTYMVYFQGVLFCIVPLIIMTVIYLYIHFVTKRHATKIRSQNDSYNYNKSRHSRTNKSKKDTGTSKSKSMVLLVYVFAVSWLPINVIYSIRLFCPKCAVPLTVALFAIMISHANSLFNPLLYTYYNSTLRGAVLGLFCKKYSSSDRFSNRFSRRQNQIQSLATFNFDIDRTMTTENCSFTTLDHDWDTYHGVESIEIEEQDDEV